MVTEYPVNIAVSLNDFDELTYHVNAVNSEISGTGLSLDEAFEAFKKELREKINPDA